MKKKIYFSVALLAVTLICFVFIRHWITMSIPVAIISSVAPGDAVGTRVFNAGALFLDENPESRIELIVLSDDWDPVQSRSVIELAIRDGVRFFISSHPSKCAEEIMDMFAGSETLLIVTASTTPALSDRDDFILRVIADSTQEQQAIAEHVHNLPGQKILVIQDEGNLPYTDPAFETFSRELANRGKWDIVRHKIALSEFSPDALTPVMANQYDAFYILAGSYQLVIGTLAQFLHLRNPEAPIILTPWARSPAIFNTAGPALSRIILSSQHPFPKDSPAIGGYFRRFKACFGHDPDQTTIGTRQALELINEAIEQGYRTPQQVKDYLLAKPSHETSLGSIVLDHFGDVSPLFIFSTDSERELQ